jgi:hypothetical protein
MVKRKKASGIPKQVVTREDVKKFKEEIIHEFHVIFEGLIDQIKLLAEGHGGIIDRLSRMGVRLEHIEKESERQHIETAP